jgi:hypothetical protein
MNNVTIFWMQLLTSVFVFGIIVAWYVWPYLTKLTRDSALIPLLWVHVPRYVGMILLVTGMVDPKLPREVLSGGAYARGIRSNVLSNSQDLLELPTPKLSLSLAMPKKLGKFSQLIWRSDQHFECTINGATPVRFRSAPPPK